MKKLAAALVLVLVVAGAAAWWTGWSGKLVGWAAVRADPVDARLGAYLPPDVPVVAVLQMPLVMPATGTSLDARAETFRRDLRRTAGVRLDVDVDGIAAGPGLVVARGRFDWARMAASLAENGFTITNVEGTPIAVNAQGEAIAVDGAHALGGTLAGVTQAIDRRRAGLGRPDQGALGALALVGRRHDLIAAVRLSPEQAGVAALLSGSAVPKGGAVAVDAVDDGLRVLLVVDAASIAGAQAIEAQLVGARDRLVADLQKSADPDVRAAATALRAATIGVDETRVRALLVVPAQVARRAAQESERGADRTKAEAERAFLELMRAAR